MASSGRKSLRYSTFLVLVLLQAGQMAAVDPPANLAVSGVKYNGLTVTFDAVAEAQSYRVQLQAKHSRLITSQETTDPTVTFSGIESNTLFEVKVDADNSGNYATINARTPPNGVAVTVSKPIPEAFTVFLEPVPLASQWEVEVHNIDDDETSVQQTANNVYYGLILNGLKPNTRYNVRARVSVLDGVTYDATQSPYGSVQMVTTAMSSLFARVETDLPYSDAYLNTSSTEYKEAESKVLQCLLGSDASAKYPHIADALLLGVEDASGKLVEHVELVVKNRTTTGPVDDIELDCDDLTDIKVVREVNDGSELVLFKDTECWESAYAPSPTGETDNRRFIIDSEDGEREEIPFPGSESAPAFGSISMFLDATGMCTCNTPRTQSVAFSGNVLLAISQNNTHRTEHNTDGLLYYSREYGSFHSASTEQGTFLFSGGPAVIPSDTAITKQAIDEGRGLRVLFPRVSKSIKYDFTIGDQTISLEEAGMDGSGTFQVEIPVDPPTAEDIDGVMTVKTRNHLGQELTSDPFSFTISGGTQPPAVEGVSAIPGLSYIYIEWNKDESATSYTVHLTLAGATISHTTENTHWNATNLNSGTAYSITVAAVNAAGTGPNSAVVEAETANDRCNSTSEDLCDGTGTCVSNGADFSCTCMPGYEGGIGQPCTRIDSCQSSGQDPCDGTGTCVSTDTGFNCDCFSGYKGGIEEPCTKDGARGIFSASVTLETLIAASLSIVLRRLLSG